MVKSKNGSKKILKSFGREKRLVKSKDGDCISIIERYRKEFGSLKVTEVERLRKSVAESTVIAESDAQDKSEQHLIQKRSFAQTDAITATLECFFRKGLPHCEFSIMLEEMLSKLETNSGCSRYEKYGSVGVRPE